MGVGCLCIQGGFCQYHTVKILLSDGFENARYQKMMINNELAIILMVNNDDFQSVIYFNVCLEMRKKCSYNHH